MTGIEAVQFSRLLVDELRVELAVALKNTNHSARYIDTLKTSLRDIICHAVSTMVKNGVITSEVSVNELTTGDLEWVYRSIEELEANASWERITTADGILLLSANDDYAGTPDTHSTFHLRYNY